MLPNRDRKLLTAYVDGELTPQQDCNVQRLLGQSPEASELLRQLEEDSAQLRFVEPPPLERDLSAPVVDAIRERHLRPARRRPRAGDS
jgi:anti-sigma factor RsiW